MKIRENNIKIIYDIDDDFINIDSTHPLYEFFVILKDSIEFIITNSDIVTVSTDYLKKQLDNYNENIKVIPNTLMNRWNTNENFENKNLNSKKTIKIGYFGTKTHELDLKIIEKPIKNTMNHFSNKKIIFEIVGGSAKNYDWMHQIIIPSNYNNPKIKHRLKNIISYFLKKFNIFEGLLSTYLPYEMFIEWIKNEIEWDIAVAPLENTNINQSKSNLKYLEYTALNIPCIYSNIGPYKEIGEKNTGIVVNNTTEEWTNALITLIEDYELYATILKNAHEDVSKNYLVKNSVEIWEKIIKEII